MSSVLTPAQFVTKWQRVELPERAASQEHFLDLCRLLGQPTPAEHDATGAEYTFEKGVSVTDSASRGSKGERGFADVWWRGKFAWEYKRKGKYANLADAYRQLCQYREALENPPLLIVSDITRTEIHTNFTGTRKEVHPIALEHLAHPDNLAKLRRVFTDPHSFKPTLSTHRLTEQAAAEFAKIADQLRQRKHDPHQAAHFLMKCMFCLFAEDVGLLPKNLFSQLLEHSRTDPDQLPPRLDALFNTMRDGGYFGVESIAHFNGGLFDDAPSLPLTAGDIHAMRLAAGYDWGAVEPSIFGTLFERSLDPSKRSQIGAHYTSREDIMLIVEPVVMAPLRHEWAEVRQKAEKLTQQMQKAVRKKLASGRLLRKGGESAPRRKLDQLLHDFQDRLASICVLDPACGSGNFLYVAIQELLALEKEVIIYAAQPHIGLGLFPRVRPTQLHGLELNPYAAELAQVVIWIGYLQWMRDNGFIEGITHPILEPLQTIECRDAILKWQDEAGDPVPTWRPGANCPGPADWPDGDFIIGNPPFLGGNLIRQGLGDAYVATLFATYDLPNFSDLCCYWHEKACHLLRNHRSVRVGLLATQAIRGGANREVLHRIKRDGDVFMAWSDREWVLEGAHVHVSMVGFDCGAEQHRFLDGRPVPGINADLTAGTDLTTAAELSENRSVQYEADKKGAAFDVNCDLARRLLARPTLTSRSSITVCRPWANGSDITRRFRAQWIVDFGFEMSMEEAARFEGPFEYILQTVAPKYRNKRKRWWLHERPRPAMRRALAPLPRYIASPMLTKHRLFVWLNHDVLPDHQLVVFARSDDYFFGVLHSSIHELWARRMGTQLREAESGFRYTPTTCFETFPLPWPPASEPRPAGSDPRSEPRPLASAPRSEPRPSASAPRSEPRPSASAQTPSDHDQSLAPARGSDSLARDTALHQRIGDAARELNEQRERWLNPPEWTEAIANYVDSKDDFSDVPPEARPLIRHSAIMAAAARDPRLKTRTLTNLYNERPTWLRLAHEKLDRAVLAAYAAVDPEGEWSEDWAEVWLDTGAGQPLADDHALAARRQETDQRVLANLLRMNQMRAAAP